jgi:hypothetical protein
MITVKLKNVSIKTAETFRSNQNYTINLFKKDGVDENSTIEDVKSIIISKYPSKIKLNNNSKIQLKYDNTRI